jgi:hypothetical protein
VGADDLDRDLLSGMPLRETSYRDELADDADIDVRFLKSGRTVVDYVIVLLVCERGEWHTVRVYDNTHGNHDMHRYTRDGVKRSPESFHHGSAGEAMRSAIGAVRSGYKEMIESWRR